MKKYQMVLIFPFIFLIQLLLSSLALADFNNLKWGMTVEEASSAIGYKVTDPNELGESYVEDYPKSRITVTIGHSISYNPQFYSLGFEDGKLHYMCFDYGSIHSFSTYSGFLQSLISVFGMPDINTEEGYGDYRYNEFINSMLYANSSGHSYWKKDRNGFIQQLQQSIEYGNRFVVWRFDDTDIVLNGLYFPDQGFLIHLYYMQNYENTSVNPDPNLIAEPANSPKPHQTDEPEVIGFNGLYMAEYDGITHYLKFYKNGNVISAASNDVPEKVIWWINEADNYGAYRLQENKIDFIINTARGKTIYNGDIIDHDTLELDIQYANGQHDVHVYEYVYLP